MTQPFLGEVRLFPWDFAPKYWHWCDGSILPIQQYQALFSLLGTQYGGNGQTTFALPDLRGRTPIHRSNSFPQGASVGTETVTLSLGSLPQHVHTLQATTTAANRRPVGGTLLADTGTAESAYATDSTPITINPGSIGTAGGSQPHNNMQPYLVMNYCIAMSGIYPSRN